MSGHEEVATEAMGGEQSEGSCRGGGWGVGGGYKGGRAEGTILEEGGVRAPSLVLPCGDKEFRVPWVPEDTHVLSRVQ